MANDQSLLEPFARLRCSGNHEHAVVSNTELAAAAQYTPQMQSAIVKAVRIAKNLPKHGNMQNTQAYVINSAGFDLDDPTLPRHSRNNEIIRPPPGGFGCTGCADNNFKEAPYALTRPTYLSLLRCGPNLLEVSFMHQVLRQISKTPQPDQW